MFDFSLFSLDGFSKISCFTHFRVSTKNAPLWKEFPASYKSIDFETFSKKKSSAGRMLPHSETPSMRAACGAQSFEQK